MNRMDFIALEPPEMSNLFRFFAVGATAYITLQCMTTPIKYTFTEALTT